MKFLFRWAFRLFLVCVVLVVALVLLKDALLKAFITHRIRAAGMDVRIGHMEIGLFTPTLTLDGLTLYSPAQFGGSPVLDVPDLHIQYEPAALLRLKLQFPLVRLSIAEMQLVEAKNGQTNLIRLLDDFDPPPANKKFGLIPRIQFGGIDALNLSIGKIRYSSLRQPAQPAEIDVGMKHEVITDVKSVNQLRDLVMKVAFRNGITISSESPRDGGAPEAQARRR